MKNAPTTGVFVEGRPPTTKIAIRICYWYVVYKVDCSDLDTITGPGTAFANAAAPGANYAYTYVAVNNANYKKIKPINYCRKRMKKKNF